MYGRRPEARDWVWKSSRRWPPSGWRVRCSLMPAAMLEIHDAALRVLWGLLEANPLRRCARRRRWAPSTIDYTHHDQKKDRARQPPATLAPSHPKPLHAGNSQAPACGAPASRQRERDLRPGLQRLLSSRGKQPPPEEKDVPFGTSEKRAFPAPVKPTELINGHLLHRRTQADCR